MHLRIASTPARAALATARAAARVAVLAVAVALPAYLQPAAALAQTPPDTTITGRVVNGTKGATVPDSFQIIILTVDEEQGQITETSSTHVDRDGSFIFENVLRSPGISYRVIADYRDVTLVTYLDQESKFTGVDVKIYEPTTSPDGLVLESYALYVPTIDGQTRTMGMLGTASLRNNGDRVFVSGTADDPEAAASPLWFPAPEGYEDLIVETDLPQGSIAGRIDGWTMTHPVPPGTGKLVFTYTVGYEGDAFEFGLDLPYGADSLRLFLADGLGSVRLDGAPADNLTVVGDTTYVMAEATGYKPGSVAGAVYEGLPTPSLLQSISGALDGRTYLVVIIWLAAAGMIAMLTYVFIVQRRKQQRPPLDPAAPHPPDSTD